MKNGLQFVGYHLVWCSMMAGLYSDSWTLLYAPVGLFLGLHIYYSQHKKRDFVIIAVNSLLGFATDFGLIMSNIIILNSKIAFPLVWLFLLWACFSATFPYALTWFQSRLWLAGLFGAAGFYGVYTATGALGLTTVSTTGFIFIAFLWAILFPLMMILTNFYSKRFSSQQIS